MRYQALKHQTIKLPKKGTVQFDAGEGHAFVPAHDSKIYLHWENDSGKLVTTYTMTYTTKVWGKVKLINALDKDTSVLAVEL